MVLKTQVVDSLEVEVDGGKDAEDNHLVFGSAEERRLRWKFDIYLLPPLIFMQVQLYSRSSSYTFSK